MVGLWQQGLAQPQLCRWEEEGKKVEGDSSAGQIT